MRAIIYSRVSTDAQERDGTSLDTQERACEALTTDRGWSVVRRIRDAASGAALEREGLEELRGILRRGEADIVVAYAVDRLSRNQNHIGILFDEFQRADAQLEFVTERFEDTAVGRFILTARAFIAEVEREKIAERTMRGKAERARAGRIPQAFGKGCYGYVYNRDTGHRDVEPYQALIVRRIFERYAETRSFAAVCSELNDANIPAFSGGQWYPITVRRVLMNEAYTGRTVYRRTKRITVRGNGSGRRSRVVEQPEEEWIEIPGATPVIIDQALWTRVQEILDDPARTARRPVARRDYALRGRLKCTLCLSAMVGQTLSSKGKPYHYYRCRHVYARVSGRQCAGRYVPAGILEAGIWSKIREILTAPEIVLAEQRRVAQADLDHGGIKRLESQVAELRKREERLIRMFGFEEVDEPTVRSELRDARRQRDALTAELASLKNVLRGEVAFDEAGLRRACASVAEHLAGASSDRQEQVLEALQIAVSATRTEAIVEGVLPIEPPDFLIKSWGLSPLNEHRHDAVLVRNRMHAVPRRACAVSVDGEIEEGPSPGSPSAEARSSRAQAVGGIRLGLAPPCGVSVVSS
ncbi:MAG: recombinase family protein [Dehalococcoidia bacterium]|nr:MAG: recombinase family protein [Dehalococcoidia bacterium]